MVKNLPCYAGDVDSIPGWGPKIPTHTKPLSTSTTATELARHTERGCVLPEKIPQDTVEILRVTAETPCREITTQIKLKTLSR